MKKTLSTLLLLAGFFSSTSVFGLALNFAPAGGVAWTLGKKVDEAGTGFNAGGSVEVEVWKGFDYGFRYLYSNVPSTVPNQFNGDTSVSSYDVTFLNNAFLLTNTWSPGWRWVDPYLRGSAGLYSWKENSGDTILKAEIINTTTKDTTYNDVKATSFGISLGGGIAVWPLEFLGIRLGVDYDMVFSEDKEKFGADDANENLLRVGGEVIFRFPLK